MSDDLVKRLRNTPNWKRETFGEYKSATSIYDRAPFQAAERIEQLVAINEQLEENLRLRTAERNYANDVVNTYVEQVKELETKLAEVVAAGVRVRDYYEQHGSKDVYAVSDFNAVIAELSGVSCANLKGEKDE